MNAVHVRGDQNTAYDAIQFLRQCDVGMVKHGRSIEQNFKHDHGPGRGAKQIYQANLETHGQGNFYGVKADRCGDIKFNIRVMHAVDAPEQRDFMAQQMLHPDREIHHQDDHNQLDPTGQGDKVEEAPAPGAGIRGGQNGGEWEKHRQGRAG